jgi:hypothetical protein
VVSDSGLDPEATKGEGVDDLLVVAQSMNEL